MYRRQVVSLLAVVALLVAGPVTVGAGASDAEPAVDAAGQTAADADAVVLTAHLQSDGDARWTVEHRIRLATDNETAAFEDLQADVRANRSRYVSDFATRMGRTVATAQNATGREMAVRNVSVSAEQRALPQSYGVVTYEFVWTNFATVEGDRIRAGDAVAGLFLDNETSLRVTWPDGYERASVSPAPDQESDGQVLWRGPESFGRDEPSVVAAPAGPPVSPWLVAVAVGLLIVAGVVAARTGLLASLLGRDGTEPAAEGATDEAAGAAGTATDETAGAAGTATEGESGGETADEGPPSELLSNEERVLQLLEQNDGRMKQQAVADQLDWTAAKTSQVVSDMREADAVETFRLGRENVVTLPDAGLGEDLGPDEGDS